MRVSLRSASEPRFATPERIDERRQGASALVTEPFTWQYEQEEGTITLDLDPPPHGVAAITLEYDSHGSARATAS